MLNPTTATPTSQVSILPPASPTHRLPLLPGLSESVCPCEWQHVLWQYEQHGDDYGRVDVGADAKLKQTGRKSLGLAIQSTHHTLTYMSRHMAPEIHCDYQGLLLWAYMCECHMYASRGPGQQHP